MHSAKPENVLYLRYSVCECVCGGGGWEGELSIEERVFLLLPMVQFSWGSWTETSKQKQACA